MTVIDYTEQTRAPTLKFEHVRGDTLLHTLTVKKAGFDFTGTTARCQIKRTKNATTAIATPALILFFPAVGSMSVTIRVEFVDTVWAPGVYYGDVEITMPGNNRKTVAFLQVEVTQDVTV
jgi:hypothetical protein